ncbi:class I SAM-dependent methyltransferase [Nakamurella deserti]|uniref:class I SAM-dependent methyltransferase n=1 Tax=Nakamurella deserti TaxID=2164074 RepID=UPI000DBE5802|nr:class I SAM-dependent methyltransferase [Nakamurella deserti]
MDHEFDRHYWQNHWREREGGADPASGVRPAVRDLPPNPHLVGEISGLRPGSALDAGCGEGAEAIWLAGQGWRVTGADISAEALARAERRAAAAGSPGVVRWLEADLSVWTPEAPFDLVTTHYAHATIPQPELYRRLAGWVAPGGTLFIVGHLRDGGGDGHGGRGHGVSGSGGHDGHGPDRPGVHVHGERGGGGGQGGTHVHGDAHRGGHDPGRAAGHGQDDRGHGVPGRRPVGGAVPEPPPVEATVTAAGTAAILDPQQWRIDTADERTRSVPDGAGGTRELRDVVVRATRQG